MSALIDEGYREAKKVTQAHAKSFYFSSFALFGQRRKAAFALYAFCRRLDDLVDDGGARDPASLQGRLALARQCVAHLYGEAPAPVMASLPWSAAEWAAFEDTVRRYQIPQAPFQALIDGMEMDLTRARYETAEELHLYCHRVAGVVGTMMAHVLGFDTPACLPFADALGRAMQLTNILRDVREDWARGRLYLPRQELQRFGLGEADVAKGQLSPAWRAFMKAQVAEARRLYREAEAGIPSLQSFGSRRLVRLMSAVYGGIVDAIERANGDVFTARARVPLAGKLWRALKVLLTPNPRALPAGGAR